jgi:hypothetical protein
MRRLIWLVVLATVLPATSAAAQEAEALRREIQQLREQLNRVREENQRTIDTLSERLRRLEAQPVAPTPPAATQPPTGVTQIERGPAPSAPLTPMEIIRPRQPFSLYDRRGAGQLLFDIGLSADFTGNLTQRNVDKANAGSFPGRENRFFPREVELNLFGQIDPFAAGVMRIEAGEEEPGEIAVHLAEAYLTLLTLPYGTQLKMGQMRNRFGLLNELHRDVLPQPDVPNVHLRFLGEEGLVERGAELTWVPPLPFYLEALVGVFNGDNEEAFGRGKLNEPLVTGRLRTFWEIADDHAIQFGVSGARGQTPDRLYSTLLGADVKYKWRPDGWLHPLLTIGGEAIYSIRRNERGIDFDGDGTFDAFQKQTLKRFGWYGWADVQPWRRWLFGVRYDNTQFPIQPGREWAVEPYVAFYPSEFLRFRLAYKHTERSHRDGFTENEASARIADELFFQFTFILGAHPAHPF